jgi:predicted kinase
VYQNDESIVPSYSANKTNADKRAQPASPANTRRAEHKHRTRDRLSPPAQATNSLQQLTLHVKPTVKAEVKRQAEIAGLSLSATGASLLEEILRQKLHLQQAATLESALTKIIAKSYRAMATRFAYLLVRIAFDTGQTRVLATNSLGRQEGMSEEALKEILQTADKRTKANLTRKTPQLTELVSAVEKWLLSEEKEGT